MRTLRTLLLLAAASFSAFAQAPAPTLPPLNDYTRPVLGKDGKPLQFEVASIRQNVSRTGSCGAPMTQITDNGFHMTNCPLLVAILIAYIPSNGDELGYFSDISRFVNKPDWVLSDRYDIDARISDDDRAAWQQPVQRKLMVRTMLQSMLAERLNFAAHRELREKPVYDLTIGKGGPKLTPAASTDPKQILAKNSLLTQLPNNGGLVGPGTTRGSVSLVDAPTATLALVLSQSAGRTVIDKTGLTGRYDMDFAMPRPEVAPPAGTTPGPAADPGPSIFTIVQEQFGLKLEPAKQSIEVLVFDHIDRPTEN